ncbi:hypothetical protein [Acetanaerobacterium elongatum]|uniref:Uncharacterized protein n=1 Tax=Acetanaerobacterium elongatum TaxID=258515 RepID=A0A1H0H385_9FIRM|nr:hypothetical protein [Acetanaerobacterium elongatum]SDO13575.1 hypothetical protein SAMN05192585_1608 [Acetanaerobacterium elongatum]
MEDKNLNEKLNWKQEFVDKQLEKEYILGVNQSSMKYVSVSIFALGIVYFLFIIVDYLRIDNTNTLLLILLNRTLLCLLLFGLYIVLHRSKKYMFFNVLYSAAEVLNCIPSRGQRKNIKFSRPVVNKTTGRFLCSEVEIKFL